MLQLYFLSVLCDTVAGAVLASNFGRNEEGAGDYPAIETYRLILGIVTMLIALLVLVAPAGEGVPVLGDLFPALAGIAAGFTLVYEYFHKTPPEDIKGAHLIGLLLSVNRKTIGYISVAAGALHFLLPNAVFI